MWLEKADKTARHSEEHVMVLTRQGEGLDLVAPVFKRRQRVSMLC